MVLVVLDLLTKVLLTPPTVLLINPHKLINILLTHLIVVMFLQECHKIILQVILRLIKTVLLITNNLLKVQYMQAPFILPHLHMLIHSNTTPVEIKFIVQVPPTMQDPPLITLEEWGLEVLILTHLNHSPLHIVSI